MSNPSVGVRASLFERVNAHILSAMFLFAILTLNDAYIKDDLSKVAVIVSSVLIMFGFYARALSPGKYILRLRVIDVKTGHHASFFKMILRDVFYKLISALSLSIGYIWAFFDPDTQTWHDKLAKTVVVKEVLPVLTPEFNKV
jgi:uncharacterized RDD family membrane protein YckC